MMRYLLLLLIPVTALAHDVVLRVDGKTVHTVGAERVDVTIADNQVRVDVRTGDDQSAPEPPPAEPPPPPSSTCGPRPRNVSVVNTGTMTQRFGKQLYQPDPRTIIAFAFTTPASGNHRGWAAAIKSVSSKQAKLVSISACPGDYKNPVHRTNACVQSGTDVSQPTFTTDKSTDPRFECVLDRGRTYYINASSHNSFSSDALSCTTRQNCGFHFQREPS